MTINQKPYAGNDLIFLLSDIHDDPSKCHSVSRSDGVLMRHVAREAVAFAVAVSIFSFSLHAAEPARHWRPATTADLPAGTAIQPATSSGPGAPVDAAAQRVHIDPTTGAIVPAPIDASADAAANTDIDAGAPRLILQKSPSGVLYVDTTGYQHTATATLDAQGHVGLDCDDPPQDAASAARLAGHATSPLPGDPAGHVHVTAETMPASSVSGEPAAQTTSAAAAAKTQARQQRLAAASAGSGATIAAPVTELNDATGRADLPASTPGSASSRIPPDNKREPRQPRAALPRTTAIPATAASQSTPAEQ